MSLGNEKPVLISTVPRSGTFWCHYFFHFLGKAMKNKFLDISEVTNYPKEINGIVDASPLIVAHSWCPGHKELSDQLSADWEKLESGEGHDYGSQIILNNKMEFSPFKKPDVRIVFVYRNPLDQALSHFFQTNAHEGLPTYKSAESFFAEYQSLEKYLKQFLTFFEVKKKFPGNILLVRYEDLFRNPSKIFLNMVEHIKYPLDVADPTLACWLGVRNARYLQINHRKLFLSIYPKIKQGRVELRKLVERVVDETQQDSMLRIEAKLGRALTGEHMREGSSHINSGVPGSWREHFSDEIFEGVLETLKIFDLSERDFDFG